VSPQEVADRLGISSASVRRLILRGELPAKKLGRTFVVEPADVAALLKRWGVVPLRH
jgi:excisionase family DNA binding protein